MKQNSVASDSAHIATERVRHGLVEFLRHARGNGFQVGIAEQIDVQQLVDLVAPFDRLRFRHVLKTLVCSRASEWERFDAVFDQFWTPVQRWPALRAVGRSPRPLGTGGFDRPRPPGRDAEQADRASSGRLGSRAQRVERENFNRLGDPAELQKMAMLAERLARRLRRNITRRHQLAQRGSTIDIRHTLRRSLRYGGLPLSIACRRRRWRQPRLILLLDVSGSMSVYSFLFLRFARGILEVFRDADAYAFHTRLVPIRDTLREPSPRRLDDKLALVSAGWHGGTRIGECLAEFDRRYSRKVLGSRSIVVIISDGYDTGDETVLANALSRIRRRSRRLVWLNPLLGVRDYTPSARGMAAALPHVDRFAPAHDLASLAALGRELAHA